MGRGLSDLQKTILRLALVNREAECRPQELRRPDVYPVEVLAAHWGWEVTGFPMRNPNGERVGSGQCFSRQHIGEAAYNSAHAALARAVNRLAGRRLVERTQGAVGKWPGVSLTALGMEVARAIG